MATTIVGFYDHISQARAAVGDLIDNGFSKGEINLVANAAAEEYGRHFDEDGNYRTDPERRKMTSGEGASAGAGIGATIGGLGGLLMGLGLLVVPGVGPALAAGPIVSALVGAGIGAASGGLMGALVNHGVPEEHAPFYAEGVRRGGSLVTLTVGDGRVSEAEAILNRHNPVDIEERVEDWRESGWTDFDPKAEPYTVDQVREERSRYGAPFQADGVAYDVGETDIATNYSADLEYYREHYKGAYEDTGRPYDEYEPAYRYGSVLARERGDINTWADIEPEARRRWEERNPESWGSYKTAVREGYEREKTHA